VIAHIVLFNPKTGIAEASLRAFTKAIGDAFTVIPSVKRARIGRRVQVNAGYERSFGDSAYEYTVVLEFSDQDGLIQYLRHPLHERLGHLFWENCQSAVISEVELVDAADGDAVMMLVK
jgi:hypothetical protein